MKDVNLSHGSHNFTELQLFVKHKKFFYVLGGETVSFKNYVTVSESHGWQVAELEFKTRLAQF